MTVYAQDDDGNEIVVKESFGLGKFKIDEEVEDRDVLIRRFAAAALIKGIPLIDMDEVMDEIAENFPTDTVVVTDYTSGAKIEVEVDAEEAPDDADADFGTRRINDDVA